MNNFTSTGLVHLTSTELTECNGGHAAPHGSNGNGHSQRAPVFTPVVRDQESLRSCAWKIGERKPAEQYSPPDNHVGLAMMQPDQGFAHWRIQPAWVEQNAAKRGNDWHHCRLVLRVYDVSYIEFTGFNAHRIQDHPISGLSGQRFFHGTGPGTTQLAEVGFVLRNGEFLPAARSHAVRFASVGVSPRSDHAALLVNDRLRIEEVGNLWEQERILLERRKPKLREPLRIATLALEAQAAGQQGLLAKYVSELAAGQVAAGHEVHVFVPASAQLPRDQQLGAVHYHTVELDRRGAPLDQALQFARSAEKRLQEFPPFDLFHLCEWMTGLAPWIGTKPTVLSLTSTEGARLNGRTPDALSLEIQKAERELAHAVDCVLTPDWLRDRVVGEFGIDSARVHAFSMDARLLNEWESPLDCGEVKKSIGIGPLDPLLLYVGPLEHDGGVDLPIEALPTVLRRTPNLRLAYVGAGSMHGSLQHRANELGVGHAVRLLGHQDRWFLVRLLRASQALLLPSRRRINQDDAVVDLARRAGKPVITTHSGPAHTVKHEETGLVTYDNAGSIVWALDRMLSNPSHAEFMGLKGRRTENSAISWEETARHFLDLCAQSFPELHHEFAGEPCGCRDRPQPDRRMTAPRTRRTPTDHREECHEDVKRGPGRNGS